MRSVFGWIIATTFLAGLADAETMDWSNRTTSELDNAVQSETYGTVTSVLILTDGEIEFERYYNGANEDSLHNTRSVTKTLTGMVVGAAVTDGLLDLQIPAAAHFSELAPFQNPDPRKFDITIEDLLTMSSSMECDDWNQFSNGNEERMYLVEDWESFFWGLPIRGFPAWKDTPERSEHGRAFSYCTAGVQVLGEIVTRAAGEPFTDYAERSIFAPLELSDFKWQESGSGRVHLGGGLELSTHALGKLGELQRRNGLVGKNRVFSAEWSVRSTSPQAVIANTSYSYGYLWWLLPYEVDGAAYFAATMSGNGGNRVFVLPEFGITAVFTNIDFNTPQMHQNADDFFQNEIVARLQ
ncbi:MAG: serine hydrolase [Pseudomonadota bacterium]